MMTSQVDSTGDAALIVGDYKIVCGAQAGMGGTWGGPVFPNSSNLVLNDTSCLPECCLFNIIEDETEVSGINDASTMSVNSRTLIGSLGFRYTPPNALSVR